tara:strand:+ start:450 stop:923 length:474 start_codon:yes stop_codon:yes gene_type:complete
MIKLKKIIIFIIISTFLLYSCGFQSVYSVKNTNFRFSEIKTNGQNVSINLRNNLSNYYSLDIDKIDYKINLNLSKNRTVKSKNKKGEALVYSIIINGDILIYRNEDLLSTIIVNEFFDYQNTSNKFDLSEYEKNIERNLILNIANDLIIKIIGLQND